MSSFGGSFVGMLSGHHGRHPRQHCGRRLGESHYFSDEPRFIQRARSILRGDFRGKDHWSTRVRAGIPPSEMHQALLGVATRLNSDTPVAARFQSKPARVKDLVDPTSIAGSASSAGVLCRFHDRPRTFRYPRPLRLNAAQTAAVTVELERLDRVHAIERAPNHDGHKALGVDAATWERQPMPPGEWPREVQVPTLNLQQQARYDQQQSSVQAERRRAGLPFRDFESAIFTAPKGDGGLRLCTDYRALNVFQIKSKFQLDGTKAIGSMIQPGDYGALVDIKDCYLEFGVHPAHRRHCRFRDPRLRRWQWRTMSFGMSEAPHLCTRILRPFMSILKGLGVRCSTYLDDLLVLSQSPSSLAVAMGVSIELLQGELGLQLKLSKCNFTPSRLFTALGVIWDTTSMQCLMPKKRVTNIRSTATRILNTAGAGARSGTFDYERSTPVRTRDLARMVEQVRLHLHRDQASEAAPALHPTTSGKVGEETRVGRTDSPNPRVRDGNSMVGIQGALHGERQRHRAPDQTYSGLGDLRCGDTQRRLGGDTTIRRPNVDDARFLHKRRKVTVYKQPGVTGEPQDSRESAPLGRAAISVASSPSTMSAGQCRGHKAWKGRSKSVPGDEHAGSRLFRLEGDPSAIDRLPISRRCTERGQRYTFTIGDDASRVATSPSVVLGGVSPAVLVS